MTDKEKLLRKLSGAQFSMWEIHVFLDTHPNHKEAQSAYEKYVERYHALKEEYESNFGPLEVDERFESCDNAWIMDPWPWESEAN